MRAPTLGVLILIFATLFGCGDLKQHLGRTWHQKCGWKAEDYFDDPKVVELCRAIEANDLREMDRLIAAGADVNALGKGKMTPLLWAYPDSKLERFKKLLEHGANPNVVIESDFNSHGGMSPGNSVTHMACRTEFPGYFEAVFDHGGDVNLIFSERPFYQRPLTTLIESAVSNKLAKVKTLIAKGADLNRRSGRSEDGLTPAMDAVMLGQYKVALVILQAGADPNVYRKQDNQKLVHLVVADAARREANWTPQQKADHDELVEWLKSHGQSFEDAEADLKRWRTWSGSADEYRRKMDAEIAERLARESNKEAATQHPTDSAK